MRDKFKRLRKGKSNTRTGGALQRALAIVAQGAPKAVGGVPSSLTGLIRRVVKGQAETKMAMMYNTSDTPGNAPPGSYAASGWSLKDQRITANNTDIKRLIPYVVQGTSDNQRIGEKINPKSLIVRGAVAVNIVQQELVPNNLYCVIYVLQHVVFKSYQSLITGNNFAQLLNTGENTTVAFEGKQTQKDLPVDKSYYRLLKKKIIPLRHAGINNTTGSNSYAVSIANSHKYHSNFTINLSKQLPKVFKYPEQDNAFSNDPNNSSIFMAVGYYSMDDLYNTIIPVSPSTSMGLNYTSCLTFKDL